RRTDMRILVSTISLLLVAACATEGSRPVDPAQGCGALKSPIGASAIGLPTSGATIESAELVAAAPLALNPKPLFTPPPSDFLTVPATPEYCKVLGSIAPVDPKAPPIR